MQPYKASRAIRDATPTPHRAGMIALTNRGALSAGVDLRPLGPRLQRLKPETVQALPPNVFRACLAHAPRERPLLCPSPAHPVPEPAGRGSSGISRCARAWNVCGMQ